MRVTDTGTGTVDVKFVYWAEYVLSPFATIR